MRAAWVVTGLLAATMAGQWFTTSAEAHSTAQCLASTACKDAAAKAVAAQEAQLAELRAKLAELEAQVPAPPRPCDAVVPIGATEVPFAPADLPGKMICLADGDHPFALQPPPGLGGFTVRALTPGQASVLAIDLRGNAIDVEGIRVGGAVWTRKASP